jgi:phosphoribosylanthranilate isomerase
MPRTRTIISGITDAETAAHCIDAGVDALGFFFVPGSVRYIKPEEAWQIVSALPPLVSSVGIFVNASVDAYCDIEEICPTNYALLAGTEPERTARECGPGVIKTIRHDPATLALELQRWDAIEEVDALLIDAPAGTDWSTLAPALDNISRHIILAGDLTPQNIGDAIRALRPYAVSITDGVERERGRKDPALIEALCDAVRAADSA